MLAMRILADQQHVAALIDRLAEAVRKDLAAANAANGDGKARPWALVGIRSRGDVLARRLATILKPDHLGVLDITLYRDDLSEIASQPIVRTTEIPFAIDGLDIVLVDDVLMSGRSVRAAMQSLMDLGRPHRVWLSVLVDRGGRELPIAADHVGMDLTGKVCDLGDGDVACEHQRLEADERVDVCLRPTDERDMIAVVGRKQPGA